MAMSNLTFVWVFAPEGPSRTSRVGSAWLPAYRGVPPGGTRPRQGSLQEPLSSAPVNAGQSSTEFRRSIGVQRRRTSLEK